MKCAGTLGLCIITSQHSYSIDGTVLKIFRFNAISIKDKTPTGTKIQGPQLGLMETSTQKKKDGPISCTDAYISQVTAKATYISYETQIGKPLNERRQDVAQSYGTQETTHDVRQMRMKEQARFQSREIHMSYDIW